MNVIWVVRKHPPIGRFINGWLEAFVIHSTHATRKEAKAEADLKNSRRPSYLYTVGKVALKEQPK
jgi:hypothetical protein